MRRLLPALLLSLCFTAYLPAQITVNLQSLPNGEVNQRYAAQLQAFGGGGEFQWSLENESGALPPGLSLATTGAITGKPTAAGTYSFTVVATDQFRATGQKQLSIGVSAIAVLTRFLPTASYMQPYSVTLAARGGSGGPYQWTLQPLPGTAHFVTLPSGLVFGANGTIAGTPTDGVDEGATFQVTALDPITQQSSFPQTLELLSSICAPTVTNANLPTGEVGLPYLQAFDVVEPTGSHCTPGETPLLSFVDPGDLPPGLMFDQKEKLAGTPEIPGEYQFVLAIGLFTSTPNTVSTGIGDSLITVSILPQPSISTLSPLPGGVVGVPYPPFQFQFTGGAQPYHLNVSGIPPGLTLTGDGILKGTPTMPGTFSIGLTLTDSMNVKAEQSFSITITTATPLLQAAPSSLTFFGATGGDAPAPQVVNILPTDGAPSLDNFTIVIDGGTANTPSPSWLNAQLASGAAPARLVVRADQGNLAAGTFSGRVRVLDQDGLSNDIAVTLKVADIPVQLGASPAVLGFAVRLASPGTFTQDLFVANSGGNGPLTFNASVAGGSHWINITPSSAQTARNAAARLQVNVNTAGLQVGSYREVIHLTSSAGSVDVPVLLFVADAGPIVGVARTGASFLVQQGGGSPNSRSIEILDLGDATSTVHWAAELITGSDWLNLGAASGSATSTDPGVLSVIPKPGAIQMAAGTYYALVSISDPHSLNSPQYVTAVLNVENSSASLAPDLAPSGLFFTGSAGGPQPEAQKLAVIGGSAAGSLRAAASTFDGAAWLSVSSSNGQLTVTADTAGLSPGIFTGEINVLTGGMLRTAGVTLVVLPASASPNSHSPTACAPSRLAVTETGIGSSFVLLSGVPATLIAQLNDDCGNSVNNGSVVASFSNGDAPLTLRGDSLGNYSATWQPGAVSAQMSITLNATSGSLQPATALLTGGVAQNATQPPVLANNGIVNAFNRVAGGALSPGTIVESYGSGLASGSGSTGAPPIPVTFSGTQMLVGGLAAPLFYLSTGQLDVQVPAELAPNQQYMAVVSANGALTLPVQIDTVPLQPGVAAYADGHVIAQHADYTLINASSPAKPGEVIIIYLLGMGPTNPPVASGAAAPSSEPLARVTAQPTVTVDGRKAGVAFAGLTPGYSGLYQIDFTVPSGANSGDLDLIVSQNGIASNTTKLPVAK